MTIHDGSCHRPMPSRNDVPKSPISAMFAAMKQVWGATSAQPAKKPARGPSVAPTSAYVDPAWLKNRVRRTNEYEISPIAMAANRNASGTARPTRPAGATPLSAIAAVGAMIPTEIAIASQNRSSRRSPPRAWSSGTTASLAISASLEDRVGHEAADDPVRRVDHLVDAQVADDAGDGVGLLAAEPAALLEVGDRRPHRVARRLEQVGTDARAHVEAARLRAVRASGQRQLRGVDGEVAPQAQPQYHVHPALDRGPADLAVALAGVRVADREEGALDADRQEEGRAGLEVAGVDVAAPLARRDDRV